MFLIGRTKSVMNKEFQIVIVIQLWDQLKRTIWKQFGLDFKMTKFEKEGWGIYGLRESFWYRASGRRQTLEEIYFIHKTENKLMAMAASLTFKNITICKPWFLKIYLTKQNEKMKEKVRNPRKINGRSVYYLNQDVILRCLMSFLLSISLKSKYGLKLSPFNAIHKRRDS